MAVALNALLRELTERTDKKFASEPKVVLKDGSFDVDALPIGAEWHRLTDVVAVVFDLKSSTNLEKGRTPEGTASIYDAGVGGVVVTLDRFSADFIDIQGDGGFGLFWGARAYERALCAGITLRTFSMGFESQLKDNWSDVPTTGFKVGIASGPVLAKRVGIPRRAEVQEPVWAGRPVNYAAKAAQQTDPEHLVVTGAVWDAIFENDYLTFSCGCNSGVPGNTPAPVWSPIILDKIPDGQKFGQSLATYWCSLHGEEFCNAVLDGKTTRDSVSVQQRSARLSSSIGTAELFEASKARRSERDLLKAELTASLREI